MSDNLAGVDDIPWATLDHSDIPGLLREVAAGSEEALETLSDYMINSGTLYEATGPVVPFLARIAASGVMPVGILAPCSVRWPAMMTQARTRMCAGRPGRSRRGGHRAHPAARGSVG